MTLTKSQYRQMLKKYKLDPVRAGEIFAGAAPRTAARWASDKEGGTLPYSVAMVISLMSVCHLMPDDIAELPERLWSQRVRTEECNKLTKRLRNKIKRKLTKTAKDVNLQDDSHNESENMKQEVLTDD